MKTYDVAVKVTKTYIVSVKAENDRRAVLAVRNMGVSNDQYVSTGYTYEVANPDFQNDFESTN